MRERKIDIGTLMPIIEEKLAEGGEVLFSPNGVSMLPTLRPGSDVAVLVRAPERLRKYDIALYKRSNGQYVLHRVIGVGASYDFIGDNQLAVEHGVDHGDVIAVCIARERGGRRVRLDSTSARAFARMWIALRPLRRLLSAVKRKIKSVLK